MIRVLIVGAGNIAGLNENDTYREKPCTHYGGYSGNPGFEIIGIMDQDPARASHFGKLFGISACFSDLDSALTELAPDLVSVAVPYHYHDQVVTTTALAPQKPQMIFCEKPIASTLAKAEDMVMACENNNVSLFVNNRRLITVYQQVKNLIQEEFNNDIISINAWCSSGIYAVGIHIIDLMRFLVGDVVWVDATMETEYVALLPYSTNFTANDPRVRALMTFENGVTGLFVNTALTQYTYFELEIICPNGKLRISDNGGLLEIWKIAPPGKSTLSYKLSGPSSIPVEKTPLFSSIASVLANNDRALSAVISGREGLESFRVVDALIQSANEERRVKIR